MRAMLYDTYGPPSQVLRLSEVDKPEITDDQVLVRVHAAGVDPGVWHLVGGLPHLVRFTGYGMFKPKNCIPGWDLSGRVEAVGRNVTKFQPGAEVFGYCNGSWADYVATREGTLELKPSNCTFEQAAAVHASGVTAVQALRDEAQLQTGQSVLVIGAGGGVGSYTVQIAKSWGATVTGVCSTNKVDFVRSLGAEHVVDYTKDDFTQSGKHYDIIVDTAGNRSLRRLRHVLAPTGTLVIVGGELGSKMLGGMTRGLRAVLLSPFTRQRLRMQLPRTVDSDLGVLRELIVSGSVTPALDRTFPIAQGADALQYLRDGQVQGKVVLVV